MSRAVDVRSTGKRFNGDHDVGDCYGQNGPDQIKPPPRNGATESEVYWLSPLASRLDPTAIDN